jgi:hypothetical protein
MRVIGWRNPASRREIEYKQPTGQTFSCGQPEFVELRLEQEHICSRCSPPPPTTLLQQAASVFYTFLLPCRTGRRQLQMCWLRSQLLLQPSLY